MKKLSVPYSVTMFAICALLIGCRSKNCAENLQTIALPGDIKLEMVIIKAGSFMMGSPETEKGRCYDEVQHQVTLTHDYWLGKCEVTQAQWKSVMGDNPSHFKGCDDLPVECVSLTDALSFCKKINEQEKKAGRLPEGYEYSLPTEAQWEYACRAGTTTKYCLGYRESNIEEFAWYDANAEEKTHPVGQKTPNAWGLYDMHGNVWEWCCDGYGDYLNGTVIDPIGQKNKSDFVYRGGCWICYAVDCRSAIRGYSKLDCKYNSLGFRLALIPVQK